MAGRPPASVRVEGVAPTQAGLRRLSGRIADTDTPAERSAREVADAARANAPFKSGALRDSIEVAVDNGVGLVVAGGRDVPYAGVQEYGWPERNVPGTGYLRSAADEGRDDVAEAYRDHVSTNVRRFDREVP